MSTEVFLCRKVAAFVGLCGAPCAFRRLIGARGCAQ